MFKKILDSPWLGAVAAVISWLWEAFWLIGPPVGIGPVDKRPYLFWGLAAMLVSGVLAFRGLLQKNKDLASALEKIDGARPRIMLKEPGAVHSKMVVHEFKGRTSTGAEVEVFSGNVPFLCVSFKNDPANSFPNAVANGVRAFVDFYPIGQSVPVLKMDGRWAESDQPPEYSQFKSKATLLETSFGFGESRTVDIAHISGIDGNCYAWNNDNYSHFNDHYVTPKHRLSEASHRVQIRLRGEFVDETFRFTFNIKRNGFEFTQPS